MIIWNNAKKKLPAFDVPVLAFCDNGSRMFVCKRVKNPGDQYEYPYYWEDQNVLEYIDQQITHWMPIPRLPKKGMKPK